MINAFLQYDAEFDSFDLIVDDQFVTTYFTQEAAKFALAQVQAGLTAPMFRGQEEFAFVEALAA